MWKPSSPWSGKSVEDILAILWKIWTWIWLFGKCSRIPLFEQRFFSEKTVTWIWEFVKNHLWKTAGQLFRETEKLVSGQTETAGISLMNFRNLRWMSTSLLHSRAYNIPLPKSTSSPILCSVLEKWETILLNPGRSKSNDIRTTIISANWIELIDNPWISSGRFSKDSLQWQSSMRFSWWWENYSVNQRTSQAGSSSYQCLGTLSGIQKEKMNYVLIIQRQLKSLQKESLAVIGLSWGLDLKRSGTELTIANQMYLGIELRKWRYSN